MESLAQPAHKRQQDMRDPFRVRSTALKYELTERMRELAEHRERSSQSPIRELGTVAPEALQAFGKLFEFSVFDLQCTEC